MSKLITSVKIEKQLYVLYPDLKTTGWLFPKDTRYELPTLEQLEQCVDEVSVKSLKFPDGSDCDDKALQLMARVRFKYPLWPFGECSGILVNDSVFNSKILPHDRNVCITQEGIKIIEPSNDDIMNPSENYRIYWVRF